MPEIIPEQEREWAEALAKRLGTSIDPFISIYLTYLPIVQKLIERVEALERRLGCQDKE
jgi:hypothetical protein